MTKKDKKKCSMLRTADKITVDIRVDIHAAAASHFTTAHLVSAIMLLTLKQISPL